jgi:hypothetical protein
VIVDTGPLAVRAQAGDPVLCDAAAPPVRGGRAQAGPLDFSAGIPGLAILVPPPLAREALMVDRVASDATKCRQISTQVKDELRANRSDLGFPLR